MNKIVMIVLVLTLSMVNTNFNFLEAQLLKKMLKKTEQKIEKEVEHRTEKRINKGVDKTLDKVEEGIDGDGQATVKKQKPQSNKNEGVNNSELNEHASQSLLTWSKYDFVPGSEIIFEDNHENEQNGEFPSKWDLSGGVVENVNLNGENVIMFRKSNINGTDGIVPLIKNHKEDYLPDEFTIEFDAYYEKYFNIYRIYLLDTKNQKNIDKTNNVSNRVYFRFEQNSADGKNISKSFYPGFSNQNTISNPGWRHVAISFNKRAFKAYIDDARVLNLPNVEFNPIGFCIAFHNPSGANNGYIKNIRIAKGAVPLYNKIFTDGKFVTTGIKFDVNKASIKPESIGTINYVVKMMQDNPSLKFCIEGHTDSDGDENQNLKLSEERAKAVLNELVKLGISSERLTSKGWGEAKAIADNSTVEGKANNRRVEFVKQ